MSRKFHITSLDIFDTLMAKGRKIGISGLIDMAKQKYILISQDDDKQKLADYVSQLPFDHDDIVNLYEIIEQDNRREKITTKQIKKPITYDQLHNSIEKVSTPLANSGEKIKVLTNPNSPTFIIEYEYKEVDFGKATMLQESVRKDKIEFSIGNDKDTNVRTAANEKCHELIQKLIQEIERAENEKLEVDEIELTNIADGKKRNDFFFSLINGLPGLQLDDVSGVKISRLGEETADQEPDSNEDEIVSRPELSGFIKEVAIKGKALLGQKAYQDFVEKGFFISSLTWKSLDTVSDPNLLVEFEAGFSDVQEFKGFQYAIKGAYVFKKDDFVFSTTRRRLPDQDKLRYKAKIEEAARLSKQEVSNDKS